MDQKTSIQERPCNYIYLKPKSKKATEQKGCLLRQDLEIVLIFLLEIMPAWQVLLKNIIQFQFLDLISHFVFQHHTIQNLVYVLILEIVLLEIS